MTRVDFDAVNRVALGNLPSLLQRWLPDGRVEGSEYVVELLTKTCNDHFGATWTFESDPVKCARLMIDHIDQKRADLGLPFPMYETPYAPKGAEAVTA